MQLDLKRIPFGKRLSRHMIYEETDNLGMGWVKGLYLALAADAGGSFIGGPMMGPKGFGLVSPTFGNEKLMYTYMASTTVLSMTTDKGTLRFVIDGTKTLRVEGTDVGLRIDGRLGFGSTAITTKRGVEIVIGGGIYLIAALKGQMALDCHWDLKALRSTDPIITIEPDETGAVALAIYDTDDAYELPVLTDTLDHCAALSQADFTAFGGKLVMPPSENRAFFGACAYAMWTGFQPFKNKEMVPSNKMSDAHIYTIEQPVMTLPITDRNTALEMLINTLSFATPLGMMPTWLAPKQNLDEAVPPFYAYAVSHLIDNGALERIPKEKLSELYKALWKPINWWLTQRRNDSVLVHYAYRHECNWPRENIFGCGTPAITPDLQTYIILATEALSKIADAIGNAGDSAAWGQVSREQCEALQNHLWNGKGFDSINALTEASAPAEGMLGVLPLLLGTRLSGTIINMLVEKTQDLRFEELPVLPAALVILGLSDLGFTHEAKTAAKALIDSCVEYGTGDTRGTGPAASAGAFFSPAACAALLTLASKLNGGA